MRGQSDISGHSDITGRSDAIFEFKKWLKLLLNKGRGGLGFFYTARTMCEIFYIFFGGFPY